jgi:hypothetical protein
MGFALFLISGKLLFNQIHNIHELLFIFLNQIFLMSFLSNNNDMVLIHILFIALFKILNNYLEKLTNQGLMPVYVLGSQKVMESELGIDTGRLQMLRHQAVRFLEKVWIPHKITNPDVQRELISMVKQVDTLITNHNRLLKNTWLLCASTGSNFIANRLYIYDQRSTKVELVHFYAKLYNDFKGSDQEGLYKSKYIQAVLNWETKDVTIYEAGVVTVDTHLHSEVFLNTMVFVNDVGPLLALTDN